MSNARVAARAAVALGSSKAEAELTALALQSKSITAVTSPDGRTECHAAAMTAKAARVGIEKAGKAARDDATQFSKAVISEEKRLVALIEPEETRLIAIRDEWDSRIAREKAEKAEAERLALAQIMTRIVSIKNFPLLTADATADAVLDDIELLEEMEIDDSFKAYYGEAVEAKAASLQKLREIYAAKVRAEAEAVRLKQEQDEQFARIKAEREEMARIQADLNAREAVEKAERDAELKRLQLIRDEITAAQFLMAAEAEKKAKAEEDKRKEQDRVQAEKVAEERRILDQKAADELHRLSELRKATEEKDQTLNQQINDLAIQMTEHEKKMVIHYMQRLIYQRQVAA